MPVDQFTHNFKFEAGNDGAKFIRGEVEFDTDGKITYKLEDFSQPIPQELLNLFSEYMDILKKIYDLTGGIKLIRVAKKE